MDLAAKFHMINTIKTVSISTLDIDKPHDILRAEKIITKFGPTVSLLIAQSPTQTVKVFLPKRYSTLFTEEDINNINVQENPLFHLVFKGTCSTGAHMIEVHRKTY